MSKEFQHLTIQTKIVKHIGRFFHQIKVRQPIGRQDSVQTVIGTSRRLDSFLHAQRLRTLKSFQIFKSEIKKKKKPTAVDVLFFKAYLQWYHSYVDPIWPDSTFKYKMKKTYPIERLMLSFFIIFRHKKSDYLFIFNTH